MLYYFQQYKAVSSTMHQGRLSHVIMAFTSKSRQSAKHTKLSTSYAALRLIAAIAHFPLVRRSAALLILIAYMACCFLAVRLSLTIVFFMPLLFPVLSHFNQALGRYRQTHIDHHGSGGSWGEVVEIVYDCSETMADQYLTKMIRSAVHHAVPHGLGLSFDIV